MKNICIIDLRETIFPFSLLHIIYRFKRMETGETMEIRGIAEDIIPDLTNVLPAGKFELTRTENVRAASRDFRLRLKKTDTLNKNKPKETCYVRNRSEQH